MQFADGAYADDDLEDAAVLAFHRLHVIMAQFAECTLIGFMALQKPVSPHIWRPS